jgi:hypothetical protein
MCQPIRALEVERRASTPPVHSIEVYPQDRPILVTLRMGAI